MNQYCECWSATTRSSSSARDVCWGERTVDEMWHAAILYTLDDEKLKKD